MPAIFHKTTFYRTKFEVDAVMEKF